MSISSNISELPINAAVKTDKRVGDELIKDKNCKELTGHDFMKLLVLQLQNQNPLEPMSSSDMMGQISSLTSTRLSESLDLFSRNQNSTLGQGMLGREVVIQSVNAYGKINQVSGVVSSVKDIGKESCKIEVGGKFYSPKEVVSIHNSNEVKTFSDSNILGKQVVLDTEEGGITGKVMALANPNSDAHILVNNKLYSPKTIKEIRLKEGE